jgi:hypothetical protein
MAKRRFYDQDRNMLVRASSTLNSISGSLRAGQKTAWTKEQQAELYILIEQIHAILAVVNHLNEIVQNDGQ